ncbi:hypothetical protein 1013_scaffold47_00033 [Bacteriophage sp.]|nr:hypothetical protein 1013_scaffold47_00033 [Bacteriophage sp.]
MCFFLSFLSVNRCVKRIKRLFCCYCIPVFVNQNCKMFLPLFVWPPVHHCFKSKTGV